MDWASAADGVVAMCRIRLPVQVTEKRPASPLLSAKAVGLRALPCEQGGDVGDRSLKGSRIQLVLPVRLRHRDQLAERALEAKELERLLDSTFIGEPALVFAPVDETIQRHEAEFGEDAAEVDKGVADTGAGKTHDGDTIVGEKDVVGLQSVVDETKAQLIDPGQTADPVDQECSETTAIDLLLALRQEQGFQELSLIHI